MTIDPISPVAAKPPAESLSVPDSARREVSLTEEAEFAKTVQADAPAKPDFSKATIDDVNKAMADGVLNNLIDQMARQRQELKEAMEEQN
jgi:hypothetical protein